jgi:hydrogenase expression/formation protein HypD
VRQPLEQIDKAHAIAQRPGVIFTSCGDMLGVPGSRTDLLWLTAEGADVRVVLGSTGRRTAAVIEAAPSAAA